MKVYLGNKKLKNMYLEDEKKRMICQFDYMHEENDLDSCNFRFQTKHYNPLESFILNDFNRDQYILLGRKLVKEDDYMFFDGSINYRLQINNDSGLPHAEEFIIKITDAATNCVIFNTCDLGQRVAHHTLYMLNSKLYFKSSFELTPTTEGNYICDISTGEEIHIISQLYGNKTGFYRKFYINSLSNMIEFNGGGLLSYSFITSPNFKGGIKHIKSYNKHLNDNEINYIFTKDRTETAPTLIIESNNLSSSHRNIFVDKYNKKTINIFLKENNTTIMKYKNTYDLYKEYKGDVRLVKSNLPPSLDYHSVDIGLADELGLYEAKFFIKDHLTNKRVSNELICNMKGLDSSVVNDTNAIGVPITHAYISPKYINARVGDTRVIRITTIPDVVRNKNATWTSSDESIATVDGGLIQCIKEGECTITCVMEDGGITSYSNIKIIKEILPEEIYTIELDRFGIKNDNTEGITTRNGINEALIYAVENGYKRAKLPSGKYSIDTEESRKSVYMQPNLEFDIDGCELIQVPCEAPDTRVVLANKADNSKLIGGAIIGDLYEHDYGMRIGPDYGHTWISGDINEANGVFKEDSSRVVTSDFINAYTDWFSGRNETLPQQFYVMCIWNTDMNTVDGGCSYVYCYDINNKYLGKCSANGYIDKKILLPNTAKIKISLRGNKRIDSVVSITKRMSHFTFEFGTGFVIINSNNVELNGTTIKECTGDCVCTVDGVNGYVNDFRIIGCNLSNARRQGISYVSSGETYLVKDTEIHGINGVDPQCGVDFEDYEYCINTLFDNCYFHDNKKWDITACTCIHSIEVRNSRFTGAISGLTGYLYDIHRNIFKNQEDTTNKVHKSAGIAGLVKSAKVYNNTFLDGSGYSVNNSKNSECYGNIFTNASCAAAENHHDNVYINTNVRYSVNDIIYENEEFNNCSIGGDNNGVTDSSGNKISEKTLMNCIFNDSEFGSVSSLRCFNIINCTIYNKTRTWNKTWSGPYRVENCKITTEFETDIAFIASQGCADVVYRNNTMSLANTKFIALNYGKNLIVENNNITFNNIGPKANFPFHSNVYGSQTYRNNNFYKSFDTPKITIPPHTTGANVNDEKIEDNVSVTI